MGSEGPILETVILPNSLGSLLARITDGPVSSGYEGPSYIPADGSMSLVATRKCVLFVGVSPPRRPLGHHPDSGFCETKNHSTRLHPSAINHECDDCVIASCAHDFLYSPPFILAPALTDEAVFPGSHEVTSLPCGNGDTADRPGLHCPTKSGQDSNVCQTSRDIPALALKGRWRHGSVDRTSWGTTRRG